jgi:ankyrin repeat protein
VPDAVAAWIRDGVDVNAQDDSGRTALMFASAFGNTETASVLLSAGADVDLVDAEGSTALDYGSRFAPGQVVNLLLLNAKSGSTITR